MRNRIPKILLVPALCFAALAAHAQESAKFVMPTGAVMKPVVRDIAPPPKPVFNVRDYGAKGDGSTADTLAIQKTIDACTGTGGSVLLEKGGFVSAPLTLKSGMTFYIAKDAKLLGSTNPKDYPVNDLPDSAGGPFVLTVKRSLLSACDVKDLTIDGGGEIDGRGQAILANGMNGEEAQRPGLIRVLRGKSVAVRQITLRNSFMWTQTYDRCENLVIEKLIISSPGFVPNPDGVDICNCRHVIVRDNYIDSQDDSICLKSHGIEGMDDVLIENNTIMSRCNAIKMGTASVGDVTNVRILNNTVLHTRHSALAIESVDGSNITGMRVSGLTVTQTGQPIFIRLGNRRGFREMKPQDHPRLGKPGTIDDILVENVLIFATPKESLGNSITGITKRSVGKVTLRNMYVEMPGGIDNMPGKPPENDGCYPEATQFGRIPAHAFYVRHADGVRFENVRCGVLADDVRPWFVSDNAKVETVDCVDLKKVEQLPMPEEFARIIAAKNPENRHFDRLREEAEAKSRQAALKLQEELKDGAVN